MGVKHRTVRSFFYAFQGLHTALRNEPNLRIHVFFATLALTLAIVLQVSSFEWLFLLFTIFYVITLELLNTVLEAIVNLVSPEIKPAAKIAKDVAAAMVLLGALMSLFVGSIIFLPRLYLLIH